MALTPASFLVTNGGPFDPAWFGDYDLEGALLPAWITDATERATEAGVSVEGWAAENWVGYRGADHLCASPPLTGVEEVDIEGKGSFKRGKSATPGKNWCVAAAEYRRAAGVLATVYDLAAEAAPPPSFAVIRSFR